MTSLRVDGVMRRRCGRVATAMFVGIIVSVLLLPTLAAAHPPCCVQCVNPHGATIPSAGSAEPCDLGTLHTDSAANAGVNPDGFYLVGTRSAEGAICGSGDSHFTLFNCTRVNGTTCGEQDGQFCVDPSDPSTCTFTTPFVVKYTEANGAKAPTVNAMGSNNGASSSASAGAVLYHLQGSGDLEVCSADTGTCVVCPVPPPPK